MNFYDILAAEKWGGDIPTMNFFDLLFAQFIGGEAWETYEGTLPATLNANGDDMRQYRVWGNVNGVGDRTENLFNQSTVTAMALVDNTTGNVISYQYYDTSATIDIETDFIVSFETNKNLAVPIRIGFYDEQGNYLGFIGSQKPISPYAVMIPTGTKKIRVSFSNGRYSSNAKMINIFVGSTAPASYEPYGYKLDMSVSNGTNVTTTPIYIGDDPLDKDEYVDYQAQKVYRMIDGTLTPTDPPVPLPALPTCEGATVIDYEGQSVAPEKVLLEYAKGVAL